VHENRGLNPYIEDVGRRAAVDGFITLAPDALSPLGGYPGNDDAGRELQKNELGGNARRLHCSLQLPKSTQRLQRTYWCSWFCFGGWIANMMAVKSQPWALQFRIMVANPQQPKPNS
jgi:carboxymethylenebutenolidase